MLFKPLNSVYVITYAYIYYSKEIICCMMQLKISRESKEVIKLKLLRSYSLLLKNIWPRN